VSRTQFYEYKRRFQTHGLEGLKDLPSIHKAHLMTTPPEVVETVLAMSQDCFTNHGRKPAGAAPKMRGSS
jgi:hypothetical protein